MGTFTDRTNAGDRGEAIKDLAAGEVFDFQGSTKGNNGTCVRVKDSKAGKNRFLHIASGKLLTATNDRESGVEVDLYAE